MLYEGSFVNMEENESLNTSGQSLSLTGSPLWSLKFMVLGLVLGDKLQTFVGLLSKIGGNS